MAQAHSNELPAAHVISNRSYTIHTPATNQINATATTTTDLYVSQEDHEYANVRRDAAAVQFCTYNSIQTTDLHVSQRNEASD